jgi:hypothetical protein
MKPLHQEYLGMFPLSSKTMHDRTQGFLGIQSLVQKQKSC